MTIKVKQKLLTMKAKAWEAWCWNNRYEDAEYLYDIYLLLAIEYDLYMGEYIHYDE